MAFFWPHFNDPIQLSACVHGATKNAEPRAPIELPEEENAAEPIQPAKIASAGTKNTTIGNTRSSDGTDGGAGIDGGTDGNDGTGGINGIDGGINGRGEDGTGRGAGSDGA